MRPVKLIALIATLCALSAGPAAAQDIRDHNITSMRSFHGGMTRIRRSFQSDAEAAQIFRQIIAAAGLAGMEDRMTVRASAETPGAEATIERIAGKEERLIFYNVVFMQEVAARTATYWSKVAILAHEVGHHVRWHTLIPGNEHKFELEADYQAGFIMRRMGATLAEAQSLYRTFGAEATPTHPGRDQRLQQVTLGWKDGGAGAGPAAAVPASFSKQVTVDFSAGANGQSPQYLVVADPHLRKGPIAISINERTPPGSRMALVNNLGLYAGRALEPTASENFLTQIDTGNVKASFTLTFSKPLQSVTFLVPKAYPATSSGITFPAWQATALGPNGEALASVSEGLLRRFADVPARSHTLRAPAFDGIKAVRFESDPNLNGRPFAAFSAILIEQIVLEEK